jgi:MOSC domain-containing protein YiiM
MANLLALPRGARLRLGKSALIELTGLRNACRQIDANIASGANGCDTGEGRGRFADPQGGRDGLVLEGGEVRPGDRIAVDLLPEHGEPLVPV